MSHLPCINPSCLLCKQCLYDAYAKMNAMSMEIAELRHWKATHQHRVLFQVDAFKAECESLEIKRMDNFVPDPKPQKAAGVVQSDLDFVWQPPHFETALAHVNLLGRQKVQNKLYAPLLDIDGCSENDHIV